MKDLPKYLRSAERANSLGANKTLTHISSTEGLGTGIHAVYIADPQKAILK